MEKQKIINLGLMAILVIGIVFISGWTLTTATIKDAKPCKDVDQDYNPIGITSTFTPESPKINVWFSWAHTPKGSELKAVLIYKPSNLKVIETSFVLEDMSGQGHFGFTRPEAGWPVGDYKVDLYFGDKLTKSVSFEVGSLFGLTIQKAVFAKMGADGRLASVAGAVFKRGEKVNFVLLNVGKFKRGDDGLNWFDMDMEVKDPNGNVILSRQGMVGEKGHVAIPNDIASSPYAVFTTSTRLQPGNYRFKLIIHDKVGGGSVSKSATFILE